MNVLGRSSLGLTLTLALAGCAATSGTPPASGGAVPSNAQSLVRQASGAQQLYIANILGGVLVYSTGKDPQKVGDITDQLPRVTGVWVDQKGVLYAYSDNRQSPYETIEEFMPGATSPFFSLVVKHYGAIVAVDAKQNVYTFGESPSGQVLDIYPPGSQTPSATYAVPNIGGENAPEGLAFDASGAPLVGIVALAQNKQGSVGAVFRLDPATGTFTNLNLQKAYGGLIATDGAGNLYAAGGDVISVYAPGATTPSRIINEKAAIVAVAAGIDGTLYVGTNEAITVYKPGKRASKTTINSGAQVSALALSP